MTISTSSTSNRVIRQKIIGSRRASNIFWATTILGGSTGFLLSCLSSYFKINLLPFSDPTQLIFVPQGLVMGLYGLAGLLLASYLWLVVFLDVGGGYNEFSKETGELKIFRWGFLGKNRQIEIQHPLEEVQSVRVDIKEGLNPKRALYLKMRGKGEIPLTRIGEPIALAELENQAAELARFLGVPLEGL
jgi:hypothetical protein